MSRKRHPNTHASTVVGQVITLVNTDGRTYEEISEAADINRSYLSRMKTRTYHVSLPVVEQILWALGFKFVIVRRDPKEPRPPFFKSKR